MSLLKFLRRNQKDEPKKENKIETAKKIVETEKKKTTKKKTTKKK